LIGHERDRERERGSIEWLRRSDEVAGVERETGIFGGGWRRNTIFSFCCRFTVKFESQIWIGRIGTHWRCKTTTAKRQKKVDIFIQQSESFLVFEALLENLADQSN
jgi:hypothetical protein